VDPWDRRIFGDTYGQIWIRYIALRISLPIFACLKPLSCSLGGEICLWSGSQLIVLQLTRDVVSKPS
jgi:hypothetical protein